MIETVLAITCGLFVIGIFGYYNKLYSIKIQERISRNPGTKLTIP